MKKTLLLLLVVYPLCAQERITFNPKSVYASAALGTMKLRKDSSGFKVVKDGKITHVEDHSVDPMLRKLSAEQLQKFQTKGLIAVKQSENGEYALYSSAKTKGGGPIGATIGAFLGKAIVSVVGHGTIYVVTGVVTLINPVAGAATGIALSSTVGPMIEAASIKGAIIGGVMGGVATGPA